MRLYSEIIRIRGKDFEVVDLERTTTKGPLILLVRETVDQQKLRSAIFYATAAYDFVSAINGMKTIKVEQQDLMI